MATNDLRVGEVGTRPAFSTNRRAWCEDFTLDFSKNNSGAGDVNQIINVPAGVRVDGVIWSVVTAEGATLTFDIGDGDTVDGYIGLENGNVVGSGCSVSEADTKTETFGWGKYYSAAGIISVRTTQAADTAVIHVTAYGVDGSVQPEV